MDINVQHARLVIMVITVLGFVPHRILVLVVVKNVNATHVTIFMAAECITIQQNVHLAALKYVLRHILVLHVEKNASAHHVIT
uniref:Uncharacterized protein n=1 Tax=Magallana gigas TaxID=29159 RepID=A0A8W8M5D6_MAGGI